MASATTVIVDLLASGHAVQFQVRGDSMYPLIRDHDYLHVEPARRIGIGDIVLVLAPRGLTAHRVIARGGGVVITRGDNAPAADDAVPEEQVLGKVTSVLRDGKPVNVWSPSARAKAFLWRMWSAARASRRLRFSERSAREGEKAATRRRRAPH